MALAIRCRRAGLDSGHGLGDLAALPGNGTGGIDRVKIPIDAPGTTRRDVGGGDFTLEWWMRPSRGRTPDAGGGGCDTNDGWITGNIVFDRDVYNAGDHGDFGVALKAGRVAFGAGVGAAATQSAESPT